MSNLANALKEEIGRLARREVRSQLDAINQTVADQRREIASLKRIIASQNKLIEQIQKEAIQSPVAALEPDPLSVEYARFSPRSVRSHRKKLNLSAEDYAKLVGVSMQTIYHWEQGRSRPRKPQLATLVALRKLGRKEVVRRLERHGHNENE